jgi:hypothetical protein
MGPWQRTRYFNCIVALVVIPFLIAGAFLIWMGLGIDPDVPSEIGIPRRYEILSLGVFFIVSPPISIGVLLLWERRGHQRAAWLYENGIPGTARLLGCEETGVEINNAPKIAMDLEISLPGQPPYRIIHEECVGLLYLARLVPGAQFNVYVDPRNPKKLLLEWPSYDSAMSEGS